MINSIIPTLVIQNYIKLIKKYPDWISFAAGLPDTSVFPMELISKALLSMKDFDSKKLQYSAPEILNNHVKSFMKSLGVDCNDDEILITNGAQQALSLLSLYSLKKSYKFATEDYTYPGIINALKIYGTQSFFLPSCSKSYIDLNVVEEKSKEPQFQFLYILTNGHNPKSYTINNSIRKSLATLANRYGFWIIEDDPYVKLTYSIENFKAIRSWTNRSFYIGSFSKIIAPTLRIGWIVGDKTIINDLKNLKDMDDLYVQQISHYILDKVLTNNSVEKIITPQTTLYKTKRDIFINCFNKSSINDHKIIIPQHGIFFCIYLKKKIPSNRLEQAMKEFKVLFISSTAFQLNPNPYVSFIRINFSFIPKEAISIGVERLALAINKMYN